MLFEEPISAVPLSRKQCWLSWNKTLMQNVNTALGRRGEEKCLILTSYSICVPRGLTRVVAITFKALNKILSWCYHSNETSVTHLLHSTILFFRILQKKFECLDFFLGLLSRVKRSSNKPSFLLTSIRNLHMTITCKWWKSWQHPRGLTLVTTRACNYDSNPTKDLVWSFNL